MRAYSPLFLPLIIATTCTAQFNCGDTLTDGRDGQEYATVLIGNQCWMAHNLNIGIIIDPALGQLNNGVTEKYCHDNLSVKCDSLGGLYNWNEMMQFTTTEGKQGVCPAGWHVPTQAEWNTLINYAGAAPTSDSMLCAGCPTGFNALLAGGWSPIMGTGFFGEGNFAYFWSSTEMSVVSAWGYAGFNINAPQNNNQDPHDKTAAYSVRCVEGGAVGINGPLKSDRPQLSLPYPNPSFAEATIHYYVPQASPNNVLVILDALGRTVRRIDLCSSIGSLTIKDLPQGSYQLRLNTEKGPSLSRNLIVTE